MASCCIQAAQRTCSVRAIQFRAVVVKDRVQYPKAVDSARLEQDDSMVQTTYERTY